jgi:hypothetical protein
MTETKFLVTRICWVVKLTSEYIWVFIFGGANLK